MSSNYPPGVTGGMIDRAAGVYDEPADGSYTDDDGYLWWWDDDWGVWQYGGIADEESDESDVCDDGDGPEAA